MLKNFKSSALHLFVAVMAVGSMSQQAHAISLRFKSKVFSSGPIIYACNAGVGSERPHEKACYFDGNPAKGSCTPLACDKAKENCNTSCVCTGDYGSYLPGYMTVRSQNLDKNGVQVGAVGSPVRKTTSGSKFNALFSGSQAWSQKISDVGTYFPMDMYTGKYFIDICYRGSNIPDIDALYTITGQASAIPFAVTGSNGWKSLDNNRDGLDFDNINNSLGLNYVTKAGLTVQSFVVCSNKSEAMPDFALNGEGMPVGGINSSHYNASSVAPLTASALSFAHGRINDPKFCKVRYVFKETSYLKQNPPPRDHKSEGAEICTYTQVQDPPEGAE
ncbi:MAG: hypothetical protein EOP06_02090 [Proteobacteria bacterium]|nr:MAG: hypothetical protein EOP06_02090 [Pseudomonadota bacterium]